MNGARVDPSPATPSRRDFLEQAAGLAASAATLASLAQATTVPESPGSLLPTIRLGPHEVIHVGDSLTSDVAGAACLGMPVACVNRQGRPAPAAGPRPTYEVADLGELLVLLDG